MRFFTLDLANARCAVKSALLVAMLPFASTNFNPAPTSHSSDSTRIIVHASEHSPEHVIQEIKALTRAPVQWLRSMSGDAQVLQINKEMSQGDVRSLLRSLTATDVIDYGQLDAAVHVTAMPSDELFTEQWHLEESNSSIASMNMEKAWEITTGSPDTVIAIIDTGVRFEHTDLTNRLLPGYDFVSGINEAPETIYPVAPEYNFLKSHDGDGRDGDPTDPGDGVNLMFQQQMSALNMDCPIIESTWHGTAMASLIAANGDDGTGMTGIDWQAQILPVRAIGRCGGNRSDLLDAIRWAAGVPDNKLPPNPTPARIINLSLGIDDLCGPADQEAIDDAIAAGAIIIAAVGNNGRNLDYQPSAPSDCKNVVGVSAVNASGQLANYSNYGQDADIAAPGGEDYDGDGSTIIVAANSGLTDPQPGSTHRYTTGTSVASPLVAGVVSLMLSVNPELTNGQLETLLYQSARAYTSTGSNKNCEALTCGAGMVDAHAAVLAAQNSRLEPPVEYVEPEFVKPAFAAAIAGENTILTGGAAGCTINLNGPPEPTWAVSLALLCLYRRRIKQKIFLRINHAKSSLNNDVA